MKNRSSLSIALSLLLAAGLVAQGKKCGTETTTPKQTGKTASKTGKTAKPKGPKKLDPKLEKSPEELAKEILKGLPNLGGIRINPGPPKGLTGVRYGWPLGAPKTPGLVDKAYEAAFQKLQAAQKELAVANTAEKAQKALDKIQKALMEVRRAIWKAKQEGRKLQPRPVFSPFPVLGGIRIEAGQPKILVPTVIH